VHVLRKGKSIASSVFQIAGTMQGVYIGGTATCLPVVVYRRGIVGILDAGGTWKYVMVTCHG